MYRSLMAVALLATLASACDDDDDDGAAQDGGIDAAVTDGGADAAPADAAPADAAPADAAPADAAPADAAGLACVAPQTPIAASHFPGTDCMSCHDNQPAARRWTVAGTLYTDAAGTAPVGGATIRVRGAGGQTLQLVTGADGNFYTIEAVTFPTGTAGTDASKCPDLAIMQSAVTTGSCNTCHGAGNRIALP